MRRQSSSLWEERPTSGVGVGERRAVRCTPTDDAPDQHAPPGMLNGARRTRSVAQTATARMCRHKVFLPCPTHESCRAQHAGTPGSLRCSVQRGIGAVSWVLTPARRAHVYHRAAPASDGAARSQGQRRPTDQGRWVLPAPSVSLRRHRGMVLTHTGETARDPGLGRPCWSESAPRVRHDRVCAASPDLREPALPMRARLHV